MSRSLKRRAAAPPVAVQRIPANGLRSARSCFRWTEELIALLGKVSDKKLAKRAGISPGAVATERSRRGIEPFQLLREPVEWTPEMISLLGIESDGVVGRELGLSRTTIRRKRELLGIPPFAPPPPGAVQSAIPWEPGDLALLGTMPDKAVAEQLGISAGSVILKRHVLRIPAFRPPRRIYEWTEELLALLGTMIDRDLARLSGFSENGVRRKRDLLGIPPAGRNGAVVPTPALIKLLHEKSVEVNRQTGLSPTTIRVLRKKLGIERPQRWTPELIARLGREPDRRIARELGIAESAVLKKRRRHGIPPFQSKRRWTLEERALLGTAPDAEIAEKLGRTVQAVAQERKVRGIPFLG